MKRSCNRFPLISKQLQQNKTFYARFCCFQNCALWIVCCSMDPIFRDYGLSLHDEPSDYCTIWCNALMFTLSCFCNFFPGKWCWLPKQARILTCTAYKAVFLAWKYGTLTSKFYFKSYMSLVYLAWYFLNCWSQQCYN